MRSSIRVIAAAVMAVGLGLTPASAAVNGTQWAVIAPVFTGTTLSYIRLFNGSLTGASTFTVMVVSSSGQTWSANVSIPKSASVQYALTAAGGVPNIAALTGADISGTNTFAVYVSNSDATAGYQHVTFNSGNDFFENVSLCRYTLADAIATNNNSYVLLNLHNANTTFTKWPSSIVLHNYWNAAVTYRLTVVDANSGATLGQMTQNIGANASATLSMQSVASTLGLAASVNHVNVFVNDPTGAAPYVSVGHMVTNASLNSSFNLTPACAVQAPANSNAGGGGGFVGY